MSTREALEEAKLVLGVLGYEPYDALEMIPIATTAVLMELEKLLAQPIEAVEPEFQRLMAFAARRAVAFEMAKGKRRAKKQRLTFAACSSKSAVASNQQHSA